MYQQITIVGRLGRDPEQKYLSSGQAVCSFSVATDRSWTDANGQKQERTTWFRISAWQKLGEICNQYLSKGRQVLVIGEMQEPRPYESKDGTWRASLDVTAREVKFLGGKGDTGYAQSDGDDVPVASDDDISEIPF